MTDRNLGQQRPATTLESVDAIREQILTPIVPEETLDGVETVRFRPSQRHPMAVLCIFDDDGDSKETVRIRKSPFTIGRTHGDVVIPHDSQISSQHAEISLILDGDKYAWKLKDLDSTNGTFVRASDVTLKPGLLLLMGKTRYRFEMKSSNGYATTDEWKQQGTGQWQQQPAESQQQMPALVEMTHEGDGQQFVFNGNDLWIGSDPQQSAIVLKDPMVSPRHARVFRDEKNRWVIESSKTLNGLWAQIDEVSLGKGGQFQCGEQRFLVRIP